MGIHAILMVFAALAALWWLYAWLYFDYRIDLLRYRLFFIRDQLFDAAVAGELDFDSDAYRMTRTILNGSLRFAHQLTLAKLLLTALWVRRYDPDASKRHQAAHAAALKNLNKKQKKQILEARLDINMAIISHIAHVTPIFFPLAMIFKLGLWLHWWRETMVRRKTKGRLAEINAHAFDLGGHGGAYAH